MEFEAIVLAGGLGTRLRANVPGLPKSLAPVANRPFLDWLLESLERNGFRRVILAIGFEGKQIQDRYGGIFNGITIDYSEEQSPQGTGGAIRDALDHTEQEQVAVLNGDTYSYWDAEKSFKQHARTPLSVHILIKKMMHFDRYGTITFRDGIVTHFVEKEKREEGYINSGIYIINRSKLDFSYLPMVFSFEKDFLEEKALRSEVGCIIAEGPFIDIGVPEDYARAQYEIPSWAK